MRRELEPYCERGDQCADDQREEGSGSVTDVERGKVEPALSAARREPGNPGEERARSATRAETEKGSRN
jgi:hypothetical protein